MLFILSNNQSWLCFVKNTLTVQLLHVKYLQFKPQRLKSRASVDIPLHTASTLYLSYKRGNQNTAGLQIAVMLTQCFFTPPSLI